MTLSSLLVRGPYHGPSGYDHHTREFVRELHRQGIAIQLVDVPDWGPDRLPPLARDPWFDTLQRPLPARLALQFTMPHQVLPHPNMANVNYTMFEATRISPTWARHSRSHDLVIVPTESSRRAWMDGGVPADTIRVCPLGVDAAAFATAGEALPLVHRSGRAIDSFATRFLNVSAFGPRKNLSGLLAAWMGATSVRDDAVLILKLHAPAEGSVRRFIRQVRDIEAETGRRFQDAAPIHVMTDIIRDEEMPRVYAAATHYISLSLGEGWDQPMVEAAAAGLQLIAPNHSAYTAYLDESVARLLPCARESVIFQDSGDDDIWFRGAEWWRPDPAEARAAIRDAIEGERSAALAQDRVATELTWELSTRRLISILSEVEKSRVRRWLPAWHRGSRRSAPA